MKYNIGNGGTFGKAMDVAAQIRNCPEIIRYISSFVDKDGFENKQFDRYVEKVKNMLRDLLPSFLPVETHMHSVEGMLLGMLAIYHMSFESEEMTKKVDTVYRFMHKYSIAAQKLDFAKELTDPESDTKDLDKALDVHRETCSVRDCIVYELRCACKDFIRKRAAANPNLDQASYFATLPKTQIELLEILQNTLDWASIDLERSMRASLNEALISSKKDEFVNELIDKINNIQSELAEKDSEIGVLKNIIAGLSSKLKGSDQKCLNCESDRNEYIEALVRENQKLKARYENLLDKYNSLAMETLETNEDVQKDLALPELDVTKRYMFVIGEHTTFQPQLSETFPNASFASRIQPISQMDIECVIAITSCIDHSLYYGMKSQCKAQNVPFIHCEHSNVELIKQLLLNTLY